MKWQAGLLVFLTLVGVTTAQEWAPGAAGPATPSPLAVPAQTMALPADGSPTVFQDAVAAGSESSFLTGNHNFPRFIGFMSDPIQSIDPRAMTDLYPIFGSSWVSSFPPLPAGDIQLYGAGLTVALSDRVAIGLNQGGYAVSHFNGSRDGWLNLGGFAQYTLIQDVPNQFLLTAGLRLEVPSGAHEVFQGHGPPELAPYVTAGKEWEEFHVLATLGYNFPAGGGNASKRLFYANVHFDRRCFGWLYPLIEFNTSYHTTSVNLNNDSPSGFYDFGDFEGTGNVVLMAAGCNAVLVPEKLEFGGAYTTLIASQHGFHDNGLIVRMTLRY